MTDMTPSAAFRSRLLPLMVRSTGFSILLATGALSLHWLLISGFPGIRNALAAIAMLTPIMLALIGFSRMWPAYQSLVQLCASGYDLEQDVRSRRFCMHVLSNHYVRLASPKTK